MSALGFTDQRDRLRRVVQNALTSSTYESSRREDEGRSLVLQVRRTDGRRIGVRFRGVKESTTSQEIEAGSAVKVGSIGNASGFSLLAMFFPMARRASSGYARVRIDAGAARLDVVCQDAEWWEEDATPGGAQS